MSEVGQCRMGVSTRVQLLRYSRQVPLSSLTVQETQTPPEHRDTKHLASFILLAFPFQKISCWCS